VYGQKENKTKYYLNSKEFNLEKTYLNPNSISTLRVEKESENGYRKEHGPGKFNAFQRSQT